MNPVLGIDLGTTNSSVACVFPEGVRMIPNSRGRFSMPSVVAWKGDGTVLLGEPARNQAALNPTGTMRGFKRLLGTAAKEVHSPVEASALILERLRKDAREYLGTDTRDAVITVPANCTDAARNATLEAADIAGLKVLRLLNEPTAAALSCADRTDNDSLLLVYDLGGGTFDVTVLKRNGNDYRVLATAGHPRLGGMDFDAVIHSYARTRILEAQGIDMDSDPGLSWQLENASELAKIDLSEHDSVRIGIPFLNAGSGSTHVSCDVDRTVFENLIRDSVETSIELCRRALKDAGFEAGDLSAVVLSGGSSRIPLVRTCLGQAFPVPKVFGLNPDEAVALGAAVFGTMIRDGRAGKLSDVNAWPIGLEVDDGSSLILVPRNRGLPFQITRTFTTVEDWQQEVEVHILQGDSDHASANLSLGKFVLSGIRPAARGKPRIDVHINIDQDGRIQVSARDLESQSMRDLEVSVRYSSDPVHMQTAKSGAKGLSDSVREPVRAKGEPTVRDRIADYLSTSQTVPAPLREALATVARRLADPALTGSEKAALEALGGDLLTEAQYH